MADQTLDPRLERLLRDALVREAASLPLTVRAEQVLERAQARRSGPLGWRRWFLGEPHAGRLRLSGAVVSAVVLVVAGAVVLSRFNQIPPAPAASLPTSPTDWSRANIDLPPGTAEIARVAAGPRGLVAVTVPDENGESRVLFSTNGRDWTLASHSTVGGYISVVANQGGFLMIDEGGAWQSVDGREWQRIASNWSGNPDVGGAIVVDAVAGGPGYVAVGSNNKAWYSTDGTDWTEAQLPPPPAEFIRPEYPELTVDLLHVAAVGDHLVAAGYVYMGNSDTSVTEDIVLASSDGKTWSRVLADIGDRAGPLHLAAGPNGFLVIGGPLDGSVESTVWLSADGETWQGFATNDFDSRSSDTSCNSRVRINDVAAAASGYVAVGTEHECMDGDFPASPPKAVIWTSADGRSWSRLPDSDLFLVPNSPDSPGSAAESITSWGSQFVVGGTYLGKPTVWLSGAGSSVAPSPAPSASPSFEASASVTPLPSATAESPLGILEPIAGRIVHGEGLSLSGVDPNAQSPGATLVRLDLGGTADSTVYIEPLGWSSGGTDLLFTRTVPHFPGQLVQPPFDTYLYVLHADGTETQVTSEPVGDAAISPDGSRVVFVADSDGGLFVGDTAGGQPVRIAEEGHSPTFSADGMKIAYMTRSSVWVVNADGGDAHQILADEPALTDGVFTLAWSPTSDLIAIGSSVHGNEAIYTLDAEGSDFTTLIPGGSRPFWSPDGSLIAYTLPFGHVTDDGEPIGEQSPRLAIAYADGSNFRTFDFGASGPWHPGTVR